MTTAVKWRWEGATDVQDHPYDWASDHGIDVAASIVQDHIEASGTDGVDAWQVEIMSPVKWAGIYDVGVDWSPHAYATKRRTQDDAPSACTRQTKDREAVGEVATNGASAPGL